LKTTRLKSNWPVLAGMVTILIWGIFPAFMRSITEAIGPLATGAIGNTSAGILFLLYKWRTTGLKPIRAVPRQYWLICGVFYIAAVVASELSIGLAVDREQVLVVGLIRLLWPVVTLILAIPISKAKASPWLIGGLIFSSLGVMVTNLDPGAPAVGALFRAVLASGLPGVLSLISGTSWALYSNFFGKYVKTPAHDFVGLLLVVTGLGQGVGALIVRHPFDLVPRHGLEFFFLVFISIFVGTLLWNRAMGSDRKLVVIVLSNLLPLVTTVLTGLVLGVPLTWPILLGASLVVVGTVWSKRCIRAGEGETEMVGSG